MNSNISEFFKQYFDQQKIEIKILVGHCEKGHYLIVPHMLFGADTIFLQKGQSEFQLNRVLERIIEKTVITNAMINKFKEYPYQHITGHSGNGNHLIKIHQITLKISIDILNDWALERYNDVASYILLKQQAHDAKMYMRWVESLPVEKRHTYYGLSKPENIEEIRDRYEISRDAYVRARQIAKKNCGSKELFETMIHHYWKEQNAKKGLLIELGNTII